MTRSEEIREAAYDSTKSDEDYVGFLKGAQWADEHPKSQTDCDKTPNDTPLPKSSTLKKEYVPLSPKTEKEEMIVWLQGCIDKSQSEIELHKCMLNQEYGKITAYKQMLKFINNEET